MDLWKTTFLYSPKGFRFHVGLFHGVQPTHENTTSLLPLWLVLSHRTQPRQVDRIQRCELQFSVRRGRRGIEHKSEVVSRVRPNQGLRQEDQI